VLSSDHKLLFRGYFHDLFRAKIHVRSYRFRRHTPEPLIQGDVDKLMDEVIGEQLVDDIEVPPPLDFFGISATDFASSDIVFVLIGYP
jgi:hypothetical protein